MNLQMQGNATCGLHDIPRTGRQMAAEESPNVRYSSPMLALDADGFIQDCGAAVEPMFGYYQNELLWQHISCLFPNFSDIALMEGGRLNPMLNYICHCGHVFEAINRQGEAIPCNLNFFLVENKGMPHLRLVVRPVPSMGS